MPVRHSKSALQSHLLRHKIFRHGRHSLLSLISQLEISEPDDVPLPPPSSKPIEALPVIPGLRCVVGQCGSLYASSKRMRRHQLEYHDLAESETNGADLMVRSASLQTFFRGTKIRYFEVTTSAPGVALEFPPSLEAVRTEKLRRPPQISDGPTVLSTLVPGVDLHHLGYLHHFLLDTSLTLPAADLRSTNALYWHHEFVAQALQQAWLMASLLTISASHKATIAHAASIATAHHERSLYLYKIFVQELKSYTEARAADHSLEALTPSYLTNERGRLTPRREVLDQLDSVIKCAHILFSHKTTQPRLLEAIITPIRGLAAKIDISKHDAFGRVAGLMRWTRRTAIQP